MQLAEYKDHQLSTEDKQFSEHQDFAESESIVTPPPDSDLDEEQIRALLASPLYAQEREASTEISQVYHSYTMAIAEDSQ